MNDHKESLTQHDINILSSYTASGNRELYWNYLAGVPGNDGYGALALGVVRNDNMPGATANAYAQAYAREHSGKVLTEREWDSFGVDLMQRDYAARAEHFQFGETGLALNLPVGDIQAVHDLSFTKIEIDPNAWTPRKLLEAAHKRDMVEDGLIKQGQMRPEDAGHHAHTHWSTMLNNGYGGLHRMSATALQASVDRVMSPDDQKGYITDMAAAYFTAMKDRSHLSPDIIGQKDHYFGRDRNGDWSEFRTLHTAIGTETDMRDVTDPKTIQELEDTRSLRLERKAAREAFHPDDPGKLQASPHPLADSRPSSSFPSEADDPVYASMRLQLPLDVSDEKVAQMAVRARGIGIHHERDLAGVDVEGRELVCRGVRPGSEVTVAMDTPAPPKEQSIALARGLDQQVFEQSQQQAQQMAMQQEGPVMRL
ncbi:hypothetical protein KR767_08925 [Luteibacter anthropi]|uniref:hypothetical protein n=1 Tax=Luteibacter anthropi TaxID=564369 RepID=UPI002032E032|nr:hypothetical protein [Luteibacter anthropi]URX64148.1 hypothetical protein KR767_08925 [Luteibacter anthropi]